MVEQNHCVTADEEAGYVIVHKLNEDGSLQVNDVTGRLKTKRINGDVVIKEVI